MAVSLRATGTWAELTADGPVTIPPTPQAGDRMFLYGRWKDFSVTATVANWTAVPGTPFADGAVGSGNGSGSVKVGCWYRDWQSGDSNPTIDFSANPNNASAVIQVWQKDPDDVWDTPVARTAAMTNWTTTSQIVSASSSVAVRSGGVVMGLIGIRDDTATITRPTTGIDDSTGAVTWNGNYVEAPATHHSTTTGDDGAADLGYRLVTTGATATLRMTGTISAAETGAALWVIQGVTVVVTPAPASFEISTFTPTLRTSVTPATAALEVATFTPSLSTSVAASPASLIITASTPTLALGVIPDPAAFTITVSTPTLAVSLTPEIASLTISTDSPTLVDAVIPASQTLIITYETPALSVAVVPDAASFVLTRFTPSLWPPDIVFIDPGGDSVQAPNYFHTQVGGSGGIITFDTSQKVNGIGSYKFDSDDGDSPHVTVPSVMGATRRASVWFRYDSVPDATSTATATDIVGTEIYSGGGLNPTATNLIGDLGFDDEIYATATPAKNSGQGTVFGLWGFAFPDNSSGTVPIDAAIKSIKIRYERKYDTDTSIGISRVKYRLDGVEGPDHDNTDQPLTDTVVEVDVTADRESWARDELANSRFEVIVEARRGDTDTEHTQSFDYVEVEVEYFTPFTVIAPSGGGPAFKIALIPKGDGGILRLIDGDDVWYDGITELLPDTDHRISWGHVLHDTDLIDIKLYVDSIQELSVEDAKCNGGISNMVNLLHGWVGFPGENKNCWFDQLFIDNGDDLSDCGNKLSTHKGPDTATDDDWDTDGGDGSVDERPLSETNYKQHQGDFDPQRQTYVLQAADEGDIDLSGKTLVGYMGWAWAKFEANFDQENIKLITNGVEVNRTSQLAATPKLITQLAASANYPSNARGIGMLSNSETTDTTMSECGVVMAYEGPGNPDILLPRQEVANQTLDTIVDDLRADPPDSYEVCCHYDEFDGTVQIVIWSLDQDGGSFQEQGTLSSLGRLRITPGVEVRLDVTVTGSTRLQIYRRMNID